MTGGMAKYEIGKDGASRLIRVFMRPKDEKNLTYDEAEAKKVILDGFISPEYAGKAGYSIDPFKAAEKILADHYGSAKMVESDYEWRPRIRY